MAKEQIKPVENNGATEGKENVLAEAVTVDEKVLTESATTEEIIEETNNIDGIDTGYLIKRKAGGISPKTKKPYMNYYIEGTLRGRSIRVDLVTKDSGGYEVLDLVFGDSPTAQLYMIVNKMIDKDTKKRMTFINYEARNIDESGNVFKVDVKCRENSDKAILEMFLRQAGLM